MKYEDDDCADERKICLQLYYKSERVKISQVKIKSKAKSKSSVFHDSMEKRICYKMCAFSNQLFSENKTNAGKLLEVY
jgi:hypothetical protein